VGWFTGASETPVVGALLPLLFGLVDGLSFGFFDRRSKQFRLQKQLEQAELTATESKKVRKALDLDYSAAWMPGYWAIGVGLFCFFCFRGTSSGIARRVPV